MSDESKLAHAMEQAKAQYDSIREMVGNLRAAEKIGNEATHEVAFEAIQEDPLSIMVRDGWRVPGAQAEDGPEEYEILLCTGGPAVRIVGKLDKHGEPETARLECQDWFTPWTEWRGDGWDESILLDYARQFYFAE